MSAATATRRTFASLRRHRNYRLWFSGQLVSMTGTWVQSVAQAWLVLQLSGNSALAVGILAVCRFGPYGLLGLFGGTLVDRFDKRITLVWTQLVMMLSAAVLGVLALAHVATIWEVDVLAALAGLATVVDTPARQVFTIEMVGRPELPNAVALNSSMFNASRVIGPAVGGLLVASVGTGLCFMVNATSFLAVIAGLLLMRNSELFPVERRLSSLRRGAAEGILFVAREPAARAICLLMLVVATISMNFQVVLPLLAVRTVRGDATTLGWLSAAFGVGALVGALVSASLSRPTWRVLLGAAAGYGAAELLLAPLTRSWAAAFALGLTGAAFSLYTSMSNTTLQLSVPDHLRGRVMGVYGYVFFGTAPLGGLLAGWLCDVGGTALYFWVAGTVSVLAVGVVALVRGDAVRIRLRRGRRSPVAEPLGATGRE